MSIQQYLQYIYSYIAEGIKQNMFHSFTTKSKSNQVKASAKWQDQKSMPLRDQNCLLRPDPVRSGVLQWFLLMGPSYSCWPFLPHHASSKNRIGCSTRDAVIYIYIHIYIYIIAYLAVTNQIIKESRYLYIGSAAPTWTSTLWCKHTPLALYIQHVTSYMVHKN